MTEPKVSERIMKLLTAYVTAAEYTEASYGLGARETKTARRHLLSAIAEIEQRAEKWKEVALAIREGALCARGFMLTKRVEAAFEALGDEWDEAVR